VRSDREVCREKEGRVREGGRLGPVGLRWASGRHVCSHMGDGFPWGPVQRPVHTPVCTDGLRTTKARLKL
jgi:hypothetical protein